MNRNLSRQIDRIQFNQKYLPAKPRFKRGFFCFPAGRVARNGYDLEIEV
jgi:hypothetical protein